MEMVSVIHQKGKIRWRLLCRNFWFNFLCRPVRIEYTPYPKYGGCKEPDHEIRHGNRYGIDDHEKNRLNDRSIVDLAESHEEGRQNSGYHRAPINSSRFAFRQRFFLSNPLCKISYSDPIIS